MDHPVLRNGDGFASGRPELKTDVKTLQTLLGLSPDGFFGNNTEFEVRKYQDENGLENDGVVGDDTWEQLTVVKEAQSPQLDGFNGDLAWVHAREGHAGRAYWPGGESGVTLDPGFDLGHASPKLFYSAYKDILTQVEMDACKDVIGVKDTAAKSALASADYVLKGLRISRSEADAAFPFVATPYWVGITQRFPTLLADDCPTSVQTALLSIAFNRGKNNRRLSIMDTALASKDWVALAEVIGDMQQNHQLAGIIKRRRMESNIIRTELGKPLLVLNPT